MADISKIKTPDGTTYDIKDANAVKRAGDTMTGNLVVPSERIANTYYGISFGRTTGTPVETILYTGIRWVSSNHMPVVHITGYAYGLQSPVEFKIGFYIYGGSIGYCGVTNMGSWSPEVYLFKYVRDEVEYVAIGLSGSCYFLQLQADVQDEMGKFSGIVVDSNAWSWSFSTTTGTIPTPDSGVTCIKVPYKANILKPANATKADSATISDTSGGINHKTALTSDTIDNFHDSTYIKFANISGYSGKGLVSSDGIVVWIPYNTNYGQQFLLDDNGYQVSRRYYTNGTWSAWLEFASNSTSSANALLNVLTTGSSTPTDDDYYISQYAGGGTTTTTYHRRPVSALWEYIKGKISSVLGLTATNYGGKASTAGNADTVNSHTVNADVPSGAKFTDTTYTGASPISINSSNQVSISNASTSAYGATKLSTATNSTATDLAATPSAVKTAYDLANTANGTANTALSGVNGTLIYDHTYSITNGVATFVPHVYLKGEEVTSQYAASCFSWKYRLDSNVTGTPSYVNLTTDSTTKGCTVTISTLGYGGHVIGTFTPPSE